MGPLALEVAEPEVLVLGLAGPDVLALELAGVLGGVEVPSLWARRYHHPAPSWD